MSLDAKTDAMCPSCDKLVSLHDVNEYHEDGRGGQIYHQHCWDECVAGEIQPDARDEQIADLTKKLAANERALERMTRVSAGQNDTIRFLRDKLSTVSPTAEQQFQRLAAIAEQRTVIEQAQWEAIGALEKRIAKVEGTDCGFDCSCPSRLIHDIKAVIARIEAPIPTPPMGVLLDDLRNAIARIEEGQ